MGKALDLTGRRVGRLIVISKFNEKDKYGRLKWVCQCDCGNITIVHSTNLVKGHTQSCGCLQDDGRKKGTHGKTHTSEYGSWSAMIQRCTNPQNERYPDYGGRGILVFEPWLDFSVFYAYMGDKPGPEYSLDRWPNNETGHYEPGNVRWGTDEQQCRNKRNNRWIEANGEKMIMADWAKRLGMCAQNLYRDLKKWSMEEIILKRQKRKSNG
jgi:hypothetical protein